MEIRGSPTHIYAFLEHTDYAYWHLNSKFYGFGYEPSYAIPQRVTKPGMSIVYLLPCKHGIFSSPVVKPSPLLHSSWLYLLWKATSCCEQQLGTNPAR